MAAPVCVLSSPPGPVREHPNQHVRSLSCLCTHLLLLSLLYFAHAQSERTTAESQRILFISQQAEMDMKLRKGQTRIRVPKTASPEAQETHTMPVSWQKV